MKIAQRDHIFLLRIFFHPKEHTANGKKKKIAFEEFSSEVTKTADSFLRTIYSINPTLRKEFSLKTIEENLLYLKKENERGI